MRWQVLLRPVGAEPLGVYWRRRFAVLIAIVVVIVILVLTLGGGSSNKAATASPGTHPSTGATTATPAAATSPTPAAGSASASSGNAPCSSHDLSSTAALSAHTYATGSPVVVTITVRNAGATACVLDTQPSQVQVTVLSGEIHNWANTDCGPAGAQPVPLAAGATHTISVTWTRLRSDSGCPSAVADEQAAAGTYTVSVSVAGTPVAFAHLAAVFTLR